MPVKYFTFGANVRIKLFYNFQVYEDCKKYCVMKYMYDYRHSFTQIYLLWYVLYYLRKIKQREIIW